MASLLDVDVDSLAICAPQWSHSLIFLWLPGKTSSARRLVGHGREFSSRGWKGTGRREKWASTWKCKHSFPSEGMLPCNHVLIGWLQPHKTCPTERRAAFQHSASSTESEVAAVFGTDPDIQRQSMHMGYPVPKPIDDIAGQDVNLACASGIQHLQLTRGQ